MLVNITSSEKSANNQTVRSALARLIHHPIVARRPQTPRLRSFTWSRILTGQASTSAVRSVAKRRSHWAGRPLATEGW